MNIIRRGYTRANWGKTPHRTQKDRTGIAIWPSEHDAQWIQIIYGYF